MVGAGTVGLRYPMSSYPKQAKADLANGAQDEQGSNGDFVCCLLTAASTFRGKTPIRLRQCDGRGGTSVCES